MEENQIEKGFIKLKKWKFAGLLVLAWFVGAFMMVAGDESTTTTESNESTVQETKTAPQKAETTEEKKAQVEEKPKQKVVVAELTGNANKSSDTFKLSGGKVTLTYDFKGNDTIVGAIYIMEEGTDLNTDGGIPEVMIIEPGSDTTIIRKSAGDYYLQVNSTLADYSVKLEEER